jgi:hypothetical protein
MKGDFTRSTFKPEKHYSRVLMQQGRVQLDADWNEQLEIQAHRVEAETADTLGACAAPIHAAAFGIITDPTTLLAEEQALLNDLGLLPLATGDFILSAGRFYVDGILAENEHAMPFSAQPDLPGATPIGDPGTYLAYLDVWQRHITFLEAPSIREVALGGPDTTTRAQTIWQVKLLPVEGADLNCLSDLEAWNELETGSTGQMMARAQPEAASTDPCIVPPSAGYRGLQNQLYRVEIHAAGELGSATFKWSRDNGSLAFAVEEFMGGLPTNRVRVRSLGRDKDLALRIGDWVEVLDDVLELNGAPGTLAQITDIDTDDLILTLSQNVSGLDLNRTPKVRRWDSAGALTVRVPPGNDGFIPLEAGVEVKFTAGEYHTGDYWLIPARTILGNPELTQTGGIEWPMDGPDPLPQLPLGIKHHYCRLALITFDGTTITAVDCRPIFAPLTEQVHLFYLGGDGQEAMPGETLPGELRAGVSNGQWPMLGARVCFRITEGTGALLSGAPGECGDPARPGVIVVTGADGVASVQWQLDSDNHRQQVEAVLLDVAGNVLHLPIQYNANLSIASQVAYDTRCEGLRRADTVQEALDTLCRNAALYYVGGDGQETQGRSLRLPKPLEVRLANGHWPVRGQKVIFRIVEPGAGTLFGSSGSGPEVIETTDADGHAQCEWELDAQNPSQTVIAFWDEQPDLFIHFNANLDLGGQPPQEPVIHILKIISGQTGQEIQHDSIIPVLELQKGILIECDRPLDAPAVRSKPICMLVLDVPFPMNPLDREIYGGELLLGFQPLILNANVIPSDPNVIFWSMAGGVDNFLFVLLSRMQELNFGDSILAHLIVKGNFVWDAEDPERYLDGEAFGVPEEEFPNFPNRLRLPSGDRIRGGDFEMWFRIVEG